MASFGTHSTWYSRFHLLPLVLSSWCQSCIISLGITSKRGKILSELNTWIIVHLTCVDEQDVILLRIEIHLFWTHVHTFTSVAINHSMHLELSLVDIYSLLSTALKSRFTIKGCLCYMNRAISCFSMELVLIAYWWVKIVPLNCRGIREKSFASLHS